MIRGQFSKMTQQSLMCLHTASKSVRHKLIEPQGEIDGPTIVCEISPPSTRNGQIQQAEKSVKI